MRKTAKPITPEEAIQLLSSALSYCQQAGLTIRAGNDGNTLHLVLPGVNYDITQTPSGPRARFTVLAHAGTVLALPGSDGTLARPGDGIPPGSDGTSSKFIEESAGTVLAQAA